MPVHLRCTILLIIQWIVSSREALFLFGFFLPGLLGFGHICLLFVF